MSIVSPSGVGTGLTTYYLLLGVINSNIAISAQRVHDVTVRVPDDNEIKEARTKINEILENACREYITLLLDNTTMQRNGESLARRTKQEATATGTHVSRGNQPEMRAEPKKGTHDCSCHFRSGTEFEESLI
jgi:hypothetical protein